MDGHDEDKMILYVLHSSTHDHNPEIVWRLATTMFRPIELLSPHSCSPRPPLPGFRDAYRLTIIIK